MKLIHQAPWLLEPWMKLAGDHVFSSATGQTTRVNLPSSPVQVPMHALSVQSYSDANAAIRQFTTALHIDSLRVRTLLTLGVDSAPPVNVELEIEEEPAPSQTESTTTTTTPSLLDTELGDDDDGTLLIVSLVIQKLTAGICAIEIEITEAKQIVAKVVEVKQLHPVQFALRVASRTVHLAPWLSTTWGNLAAAATAAAAAQPEVILNFMAPTDQLATLAERHKATLQCKEKS